MLITDNDDGRGGDSRGGDVDEEEKEDTYLCSVYSNFRRLTIA